MFANIVDRDCNHDATNEGSVLVTEQAECDGESTPAVNSSFSLEDSRFTGDTEPHQPVVQDQICDTDGDDDYTDDDAGDDAGGEEDDACEVSLGRWKNFFSITVKYLVSGW
jgi:hypothetical protein